MRALGLMSGTSMDGVDIACIDTDGERIAETSPGTTTPYEDSVRALLGQAVAGRGAANNLAALERALTDSHERTVGAFLADNAISRTDIAVVGFHGHTLYHRPEERRTCQVGDGARLARRLGIDVVGDFRSADVSAGGQGAPFAPLYHQALARGLPKPLGVLNLGGVANITWLGDDDAVIACDTGPANAPLDDWVRRHGVGDCDRDGRISAAGIPDQARLARWLDHPFFTAPPPKSLDRNDFTAELADGMTLADGAATLAASVAVSVARVREHLPQAPLRWLVTGGGRHNPTIMAALAEILAVPVEPVEAVGWQGDALEAQAFAFLAVRSLKGLPLSLPSTTGVPRPMPGGRLFRARDAA